MKLEVFFGNVGTQKIPTPQTNFQSDLCVKGPK